MASLSVSTVDTDLITIGETYANSDKEESLDSFTQLGIPGSSDEVSISGLK